MMCIQKLKTTVFAAIITAQSMWLSVPSVRAETGRTAHRFEIGRENFLLDGKPLQIRCGEIHFARVPREYWRQRLKLCRAMGLNAVCAYLFWNYHEFEPGHYNWAGQADAAEFCRIAQEEGLWVVLRPGPYACAEWDGGGLPWWLLKNPQIQLRTSDPAFIKPASAWLKEVGRVLGPLQVSKGGPILMVQAENEYGSYGSDTEYMGEIRQALLNAGFEVPLFACDPAGDLRKGLRSDLFQVVNFGSDPKSSFAALRAVQPTGPLMCGEFYPGWFDTWGEPHHRGDTAHYLADLGTMLDQGASFSIYMAHGGTSFGLWSGADRPFKPDTSSYDYDAPISEAGWIGEKFRLTRDLIARHLPAGETLPEPPPPFATTKISSFQLTEVAPLFDNLSAPEVASAPLNMETLDQGHGCTVYRTTLPSGSEATLAFDAVHDFGWVFLNGKPVGKMDRRTRTFVVKIPARAHAAQLDVLVEAVGHVNYGREVHDRKGLEGGVRLTDASGQVVPLTDPWQCFRCRLDDAELARLDWKKGSAFAGPAFWRGHFDAAKTADTFLDLRNWGKGVVWVNGHCLARYWNIGPTQTAFLPGAWLRPGKNEVVVLDLLGPSSPTLAGLPEPILDQLRPERDFAGSPEDASGGVIDKLVDSVHAL